MTKHNLSQRLRRGFSIVELVLVMSILAIVAALAAPRYALALDGYRAEHAARRIAADISATQAAARATATTQAVVFNPATNSYSLPAVVAGSAPARVTLGDAPFFAVLESATFNGTATLTFNGYALPKSAGTVVVRSGQTRRTISIAIISGATTVQ
jgi:prepilin-type N-terminal cleavage/methylation domain-containing protein